MATGERETVTNPGAESASVDVDAVFHILSNRRRRHVVRVLQRTDGAMDIGDIAEAVAAWEHDIPAEAVTHRQRKSAYTALHQTHLPKLADAGFVESDREWVDVRLTDRAHVLEALLDDVTEPDPSRKKSAVVGFALGLAVGVLLSALFDATVLVPSVALPLADTKLRLVRRW